MRVALAGDGIAIGEGVRIGSVIAAALADVCFRG
jgi:hypothetical protein